MKAVILAAGLGSRFKSDKPKVLHEILGKPVLWYVVNAVERGGIEDIAIVVGYGAEEVKKALGDGFKYFLQENPKGGTANAVLSSMDFWRNHEGYILIINGDTPLVTSDTIKNMQRFLMLVEEYEKVKLAGVVLSSVLSDPTGYGRIVKEEGTDKILKIVEEKDASPQERNIREVNGGVYMFYVPYLLEALFKIKPSEVTGELYLTDVVSYMVSRGYEVRSFMASDPTEILGINTRWELSFAENILRLKLIKFWAEKGVTFHIPETVWIEPDVTLSRNVEIFPGVTLRGKTKLSKDVVVKTGAVIEDSELGEGVVVEPYSFIRKSKVGAGAIVGPYAHVRENSVIGEKGEIGNFVEVKKSRLGSRVKAKHLAYIGDATVGDNANIGAGVVTANYDGRRKHKTEIGENAFIGSNSLLVAPIKIGNYAYIAGGSVITKDVPDEALAVERGEQRVLKGKGKKLLSS
ncbi:UDP-N-acetylglucosamine pyrophosphorylase /glucosamine-1-phosphate N-acetyltransferase [Hydrogenivirga caldilitoris]|uniref:Bifunctional protein GlmU n=1 Tax=Hydrogenivirga caldilitoris TaxID=246264 RepID=A0A497XS75_9AQUI|nr:bifunctional UDP-N-acetylglucosamine diphosphorylase/glucosamine-1-phosphate N-acetyltransferase GlmU [Hydrogenivirga caldilitoris]RLJ71134.1 UDP-N-acetylglucosamine pyrophosphorylase /glucosamine-1-phosphate N-acetyltransferase [Hydrogenivirga caldilitoris]